MEPPVSLSLSILYVRLKLSYGGTNKNYSHNIVSYGLHTLCPLDDSAIASRPYKYLKMTTLRKF